MPMSEENTPIPPDPSDQKDTAEAQTEEEVKLHARGLMGGIWQFLKDLMNIQQDTDYDGAVVGIKSGIDFRGYNVWVLICSIVIASIGLNTNSTAVIIGAMLISPLMGPIVGAGMAIGINDLPMLFRSLKSFGVAVGISLLAAFIYFWLTPLDVETSELLGRVKPTLFDVAIGIFGGLAGIIAATRKEKTNVIPGVAIATALMPPLCTAGYGLASGHYDYFFGALYLFLLNSVFIWLATFITVRYLNFPMKEYPNPARERRVKGFLWAFALLVIIPSGVKLYGVINESRFEQNATTFVEKVCRYDGSRIFSPSFTYDEDVPKIEVFATGKQVPKQIQEQWIQMLPEYDLEGVTLLVQQTEIEQKMLDQGIDPTVVKDLFEENTALTQELAQLKSRLESEEKRKVDYQRMAGNLSNLFPQLVDYSCGPALSQVNHSLDTCFTMMVRWDSTLTAGQQKAEEIKLARYLASDYVHWRVQLSPMPSKDAVEALPDSTAF